MAASGRRAAMMLESNFSGSALADLRNGCNWFVDWFGIADNPGASFTRVTCPAPLVTAYQTGRGTGPPPPTQPTHTLTMTRNINAGGTTTPASTQNVIQGTTTPISVTVMPGYRFDGWSVVTGNATIASRTSTSTTVTLTGNATIQANFTVVGQPGTYTLTVARNPAAGGTTTPAAAQANIQAGTPVTITATPATGYAFNNWTVTSGTAVLGAANNASTTITLSTNATVTANFRSTGTPPTGGTDTTRIEAESLTNRIPNCNPSGDNPMCIGTNTSTGVTNIGWISSGDEANYTFTAPRAGSYTMQFRIALNAADVSSSTFEVFINNTRVGTINSTGTGGWDTYQTVTLSTQVQLRAGSNEARLNFGAAINVDYFQFIGQLPASIRHTTASSKATPRTNITLRSGTSGFTALLPSNHSYTSYTLIDLQGREIQKGRIGAGTTDLRFDNIRNVTFLRLEGRNNTSTVVRAVTY